MILKWKIDQINFERWRNSCTFLPLLLNAASSSVQPVKRLSISVFLSLSLSFFGGQIDREETKIASIGGVRSWRLARRQNGANKVRDRPSNCQTQRTIEFGTRYGWGGGSRRLCIRQRPFIRYSTRQTATQTLLEIIRVSNGGVLVPSESSKR